MRGSGFGPKNDPRARAVAGLLLFAVSLLVLLLCMDRRVGSYDEGIILFGAARIADGDVLHRDFYANYGPGQFCSLALLFKLFSPSVLVERLWDTVERASVVVLVFLVVARAASPAAAWSAALAALAWLASFGYYGYPVFPALAAALASLLLLLPTLEGAGSAPGLLAAGACAGIAGLFRYDVGFFVFAAEASVLCASVLSRTWGAGRGLRGLARVLLPFGAGVGAVALPLAAAYAAWGVMGDFLFDVVAFPSRAYASTRGLPFPGRSVVRASPSAVSVYLPLLACVAALPTVLALGRRARSGPALRDPAAARQLWTLLALVALTLAFFAKGVVRVSVTHMAMAILSSLALLAVLASRMRERGPFGRLCIAAGLAGAIACTAAEVASAGAGRRGAWLLEAANCRPPAGLGRLGCFTIGQNRADAIRYVQRRTDPGDFIFSGPGRYDKVYANDILFYFLSGRRSATKWHHVDPGLQTTAPIQREIVAELARKRPRFIVLNSEWDEEAEPNASARSSGVTILDGYIRGRFTPVATFGTITVLQDLGQR